MAESIVNFLEVVHVDVNDRKFGLSRQEAQSVLKLLSE